MYRNGMKRESCDRQLIISESYTDHESCKRRRLQCMQNPTCPAQDSTFERQDWQSTIGSCDHFWLSTWLTSVSRRLKVALDFRDDAINIFRGIARLHVKEVGHRLLALALRHPGLLDQFFKQNFSTRTRFDNSFL